MNRTDGYTTDVSYPAFFYKEMQPVWLSSVARFLGFAAPELNLPFAFCELGCGVGINLLVAAASHPEGHFVGVDFNEKHLQIARDAARASGLRNIEFIHSGFAEFERANRTPFDFIVTHGVWSWIAPQHQAGLLACVSASLKPGGIFYLHYMCHPGSTDMLAIQHFLNVFSHHIPGTSAQRVEAGLKLLRQLGERGLFVDKPGMLAKLQGLEHKDPAHLAHEFLTDHWRPQHAVEVHQQVGEAGLAYLGSADVFNNLDPGLSIPGGLQAAVRQVAAPALAETVKDMARNSHQRMDLFQREPRPLSREARFAALDATVFVMLPGAPTSGAVSFASPIGNIAGPAEIFSPLLQALAAGPVSFARLAALPAFAGQAGLLFQSLQLLMLAGFAHPLKPVPTPANAAAHKLAQWFAMQGVSLRLVDECATAVAAGPD